MLSARPAHEVVVEVPNDIGVLSRLVKIIAEKGINILATRNWVEGDRAILRLVTDDNLRTTDALTETGYVPTERPVICVELPHKPGMLEHITSCLARENIDLAHLYASATIDQERCTVILGSSNNDRAVVLLNQKDR